MTNTRDIHPKFLKREDGQSLVEFVIVLPVLALLLFGILQFGVVFYNYLAITDAVRVGARAAAVKRTTDPCGAAQTAIQNTVTVTQWSKMAASFDCKTPDGTDDPGGRVIISVKFPYEIGLPDFSASGNLNASVTERLE
jgi:Flp pilus assembly protein TadG